jgi:hypothetical protein
MYYGVPETVTYIIEEMGGGCAFFDYDNDGWISSSSAVGGWRLFRRALQTASTKTTATERLLT